MSAWKQEEGEWTEYRRLPLCVEVDFHRAWREDRTTYRDGMVEVGNDAFAAIETAHRFGLKYVIFTHGRSTSGPGKTTARSMVRELMRSPASTPFIQRRDCIQHPSCFVAAIRDNPEAEPRPERPPCPKCGSMHVEPMTRGGEFRCQSCRWRFTWLSLSGEDPMGYQDR